MDMIRSAHQVFFASHPAAYDLLGYWGVHERVSHQDYSKNKRTTDLNLLGFTEIYQGYVEPFFAISKKDYVLGKAQAGG